MHKIHHTLSGLLPKNHGKIRAFVIAQSRFMSNAGDVFGEEEILEQSLLNYILSHLYLIDILP